MKSLRISIVQYLNTAPLVRGFTHGPLRGKYELSFTVPSQCAEALRSNSVDVAIIPAIEYQRIPDLALLPNLAIASKRSVRSLLLVSRKPLRKVERIALDRSSRSTQALTRILCRKAWGIAPEFLEAEPNLPVMLDQADAALLIGDPALHLAMAIEASAVRTESGILTCPGYRAGLPEAETLFVHDMVEEWRALTGLPAVLAVWAARREAVTREVVRDFEQSFNFGMQHLKEISSEASQTMGLPAESLQRYLTDNIDYRLDAENLQGLRRYYEYAAEAGLIAGVRQIEIALAPPDSERRTELAAMPQR